MLSDRPIDLVTLLVYIAGRPFVLRDSADPRNTVELSDRAESLEAIEVRLKNDVLAEAARYVHAATPGNHTAHRPADSAD